MQQVKHFRINALCVNNVRDMSMLPDDTYDAFVIDARDEQDEQHNAVTRVELTITSGEHKGDVVAVRAPRFAGDAIDLIGLPARLIVRNGTPTVDFEGG